MSITERREISSRTIGFSVSAGNVSIASTLPLTSSTTLRASAPNSSSMITEPIPSEAVEMICLMPSIPWIASSTRTLTASSTSAGAAPRYGIEIVILSSENSGNTSCLTVSIAITPLTMISTISRLAATELRANQSIMRVIFLPPRRPAFGRVARR